MALTTAPTAGEPADLAKTFAARRGKTYPAYQWLAAHFPDYVEVMIRRSPTKPANCAEL